MDQFTNQRKSHHSPNFNFFLQQQTFTAGYMRPEMSHMRPEMSHNQHGHFPRPNFYLHSGPFPHPRPALYDMHEREMEKRRIREEIMYEMARSRELEDEVRRELKMERELALRAGIPLGLLPAVTGYNSPMRGLAITDSPLEERMSLSIEERMMMKRDSKVFEPMPFQRGKNSNLRISEVEPVLERGEEKKKIIILAKPDTNTSGSSKRKAKTPPAVDASNEPPQNLILKKKAKKEWSCTLCQINATSNQGLNEHLQGKKHKLKEAASRNNSTGKNYVIGLLSNKSTQFTQVASEPLKDKPKVTANVQKNGGQEKKKYEKNYRHWCEICQVGTHSKKVMDDHMEGKSHLRRMSKNMLKVETLLNEVDGHREDMISEKVEKTLDRIGSEHHGAEDRLEPDCGAEGDHGSSSGKTEVETEAEVCEGMDLTKTLDYSTSDVVMMDNVKDAVAGNIYKHDAVPENGTKAKDNVARHVSKLVDVVDASPENATEAEDVVRNLPTQEDVARDICESEAVNEQSPGDGSK